MPAIFEESAQNEIAEGETVNVLVERLGLPKKDIKIIFVNNKVAKQSFHPLWAAEQSIYRDYSKIK